MCRSLCGPSNRTLLSVFSLRKSQGQQFTWQQSTCAHDAYPARYGLQGPVKHDMVIHGPPSNPSLLHMISSAALHRRSSTYMYSCTHVHSCFYADLVEKQACIVLADALLAWMSTVARLQGPLGTSQLYLQAVLLTLCSSTWAVWHGGTSVPTQHLLLDTHKASCHEPVG